LIYTRLIIDVMICKCSICISCWLFSFYLYYCWNCFL